MPGDDVAHVVGGDAAARATRRTRCGWRSARCSTGRPRCRSAAAGTRRRSCRRGRRRQPTGWRGSSPDRSSHLADRRHPPRRPRDPTASCSASSSSRSWTVSRRCHAASSSARTNSSPGRASHPRRISRSRHAARGHGDANPEIESVAGHSGQAVCRQAAREGGVALGVVVGGGADLGERPHDRSRARGSGAAAGGSPTSSRVSGASRAAPPCGDRMPRPRGTCRVRGTSTPTAPAPSVDARAR